MCSEMETPSLFPQLEEMNDEEKYYLIAPFIPCDLCSTCNGFHLQEQDKCQCGHDTFHHIDNGQDLDRRVKVALRLNELLEVTFIQKTKKKKTRFLIQHNRKKTSWIIMTKR